MATKYCHHCQKGGASSHCGKCNAVFYCSRDCQVADWKTHKKFCNVVAPKQAPIPGVFTMTKTPKGNQISFGYQAASMSMAARDEFEAAVAAVEAAGIEPPALMDAGVTSIRMAITALNVPFIATLWLQETQYGADAPEVIRRVQELATKITGAPHIFHMMMHMAGDKLAPTMSCKSADIKDQDSATQYLSNKYSARTTSGESSLSWVHVGVTHFLYLLEQCCSLDMQLLRDTLAVQERSQRESNWEGKEEELKALHARVEAAQLYSAGQDLFELLTELMRRSMFDNTLALEHADIDIVVSNDSSRLVSTEDKSVDIVTTALQSAAFSGHRMIHSVHIPKGTSSNDILPYFTLAADKNVPVQFSTLLTWNTCNPQIKDAGHYVLTLSAEGTVEGELALHKDLVDTVYSSSRVYAPVLLGR
jgi:hypothetical protein